MADGNYQRLAAACGCGAALTQPKRGSRVKHCSAACRIKAGNDAAKTRAQRRCETCSRTFGTYARNVARRWCSDECKPKALRGLFSCVNCGVEYKRNPLLSGRDGKKFCSRDCAFRAKSAAAADRRSAVVKFCPYFTGTCATCGQAWGDRSPRQNCQACDRRLRAESKRNAARQAAEAIHRAAARVTACGGCGAKFCPLYGHSHSSLCVGCSVDRQMAHRRAAKARRKARQRGVAAETFDPLLIFARDKWRCQLCGCKTPRQKRGTYDGDAPELDHIVPLALGGPHTQANTQCACRTCNQAKGATAIGQLMLFG